MKPLKKQRLTFCSKSLFLRFLISYLLILLIPLGTIVFTYFNTVQVVKNEVTESNAAALTQLFQVIDTKLRNMGKTALQVYQDSNVSSSANLDYLFGENSDFAQYQTKTSLQKIPREDYSDIFIYYKNSQSILSAGYSRFDSESYYKTYYNSPRVSYQTWLGQLQERSNQEVLLSCPIGAPPTLTLLQSFPLNSLYPSITVGVVLDPILFSDLLKSSTIHKQGAILIFDRENNLLASSNASFNSVNLNSYNGQEMYYDTFDGQECVLQIFPSSVAKCTYVSVIPTCVFWEKANSLQYIIVISLLLCILLSGILVIMLTRYSYNPVTSLLTAISSKTNIRYDNKRTGEIEYIDSVLNQVIHEKNTLHEKLESEQQSLRNEFFFQALRGVSPPDLEVTDYFSRNGIQLISNRFCVVLFQVETCDKAIIGDIREPKTKDIISFIMNNVLQEFCAEKHLGFILHLDDRLYACLINLSETPAVYEDVHTICEKASSFFKNSLGIGCSVSMSHLHEGGQGIHTCYMEALHAMEYSFVFGKNTIISYDNISKRTFEYHYNAHSSVEQILLHYMKGEEAPGTAKDIADTITKRFFFEETASLEVFKCFKYDMINLVNKIANEICTGQLQPGDKTMSHLMEAESFAQFKCLLAELLEKLRGYQQQNMAQNDLSSSLMRYIDANYSNADLNVNTMGDCMHLTPYYLSKIFKNQTGLSPLEYLSKVRITKAKELLQNSPQSIEEIAHMTGFLSSSVFIRAFKKSEGITPGAFKTICENGEAFPSNLTERKNV